MDNYTEENREKFDDYIIELREMYEKNPTVALQEARASLQRMRSRKNGRKRGILSDINIEVLGTCIFAILIALLGLLNIESIPMYIFGLVFFLAGHLVGMREKGLGLVFLFSHGVTGLCIMVASQIGELFSSPLIDDLPKDAYFYMIIALVLFVMALLMVILYNLSDNLKSIKGSILIPILLYAIAFLMVVFFPRIYGVGVLNIFSL